MKDKILLEQIKNFLGVGEIHIKTSDSIIYSVKSIKDLLKLLYELIVPALVLVVNIKL